MTFLAVLSGALALVLCYTFRRYRKLLKTDKKILAALSRHEDELAYWRNLVHREHVQIGCSVDCNTVDMFKYPEYVKDVSERALRGISDCVTETLRTFLLPYLMEHSHEMWRCGRGRLDFRIPMIRSDFKSLEVTFVDMQSHEVVPILNERMLEKQEFMEQTSLRDIATALDKMGKII